MEYQQAVALFGEEISIDASNRKFLVSLVDFELTQGDILFRLEISFLETLEELKPGSTGGRFNSIKTGRLSSGLLVDWGMLNNNNGKEFVDFARQWDPGVYYSKGSQSQRCLVTAGIITASITEFQGPTGLTCAGMVRVSVDGGKLAIGGNGPSQNARNFICELLKGNPAPKAEALF